MGFRRIRVLVILVALAVLMLAESCTPQRYPAKHRYGHSRGCNCPKF